ncbi:hypothetical protein ABMA28_000131 [Loxostege sticticalis]|uniref:Nuclear pore complex protein Nup153 n=1 Tax=Loxostege sticticalis TaxID=481309 RepID=A0ABD0TRJ8_LOXSC
MFTFLQSFVKNVTSRVSGLLPATITRWFSSPSSSNANGSTQAADATDSSTEDEAPESPITTQPPSKRMRFSSPGKFNHFGPNDSNCVPTNIDTIEQSTPYSMVQSPPGRTTFRRETNYVSTPIRASNEESVNETSERDSTTFNKSQHSVSNVGQSVATKRKSLFDSPSNREASMRALKTTASNVMVDPKAPCFKPSLLGSPFYPGRTMYGGASTSTYINHPNIKQRKVAQVNESSSSDNTAMSHSARRVMDLLENYSSPLMEARRISQFMKNSSSSSQNDTLNSTTVSGSPYANKVLSYKTQELHVPNIATILRLKQRSRLMDTTNAARQIIASHSSTSDYFSQPYPTATSQNTSEQTDTERSSKLTTKMKNKLTRPKRGESIAIEEQTVTPVNLPTAVLQIDKDNLPKFTFGIPAPKPASDTTPKFTMLGSTNVADKPPASVKVGVPDLCKPTTVSNNDLYKFASPVRISSEQAKVATTPPKFTFGSPERDIDKPKSDNKKDDNPSYVIGQPKVTEKLPISKSADWKCPDCWVSNKPDANNCVCCGAKQPSKESAKQPKCTICKLADSQANSEKCINCEKVQLNNNTKTNLVTADASKWKCEDCWVSNDESADKCVCCGGKNPKKTSTATSAVVASADSEWKCEDCWIKNKSGVDKCAACGGARPGAKPKSAPTLPANDFGSSLFRTDNSLKNIAKAQSDKWECTSCLVRNENNRTKCVCCDEDKPGTIKALDNKKSFNFGSVTATSFKFGIDPKAQEASSTKPEVKFGDSSSKSEESETNNNVYKNSANRSSSTVFGAFGKKPDDQTDAATEKIVETPKMGFTFGIPKTQAPTEPAAIPVFGAPKKLAESIQEKPNEEKEKPQEVPKVDFKLPTTKESPKPLTAAFTLPVSTPVNQEKPLAPAPSLLNPLVSNVSTENKESTGNALTILPKATSSESLPQQSTFTFSGIGGLKPPQDMFAAPASTAAPTFAAPAKSLPTTSAMSLFQKPEPTATTSMFQNPNPTTSTVSMFQKTETATTAAPLFNFGSNTAPSSAPQPQPEKPKFNFSFSNSTPLFNNNTFGATPDNANTNKFGITGSGLGGAGNGLSAANPLAGSNSLGSGKLGTNELSSNPLSSGNEMPSGANLFGVPAQKENLWSNNSSTNLFVSNASSNPLQKPPAFTFGSSTPFNANNPAPAFGANTAATQNNPAPAFGSNTGAAQNNPAPAFGSNTGAAQNTAAPAFGSSATPAQNMFGMNQSANAQPSMFSSPVQNQPAPIMFGSPQPATNPAPAMNLFRTPSVGATPTFGTPNSSIPTFEAPSLTPAPAPAFNFGAPQQSTGVFGFGQQPQSQQPQQAGVYSFGAAPGGAPQVQFNMGSAPSTVVRRMRKAFRRNPQR